MFVSRVLLSGKVSDEGPSLETLHLVLHTLAARQIFIFPFVFQHCPRMIHRCDSDHKTSVTQVKHFRETILGNDARQVSLTI